MKKKCLCCFNLCFCHSFCDKLNVAVFSSVVCFALKFRYALRLFFPNISSSHTPIRFFCLCFLMHFLPNCNFRECKKRKTTNVDKKDRVLCKNTFRVCFLIQRRHVCWGLFGFFYSSFSLYLFLFCSFNTLLYTHFGYS